MGDEHLDTIPATESDEFIKSGVENLIPIPSESEGILDHVCDVPSHDNSPPLDVSTEKIDDLSESTEEFSSTDDDSFSLDNIDYVEVSPPDSELVSLEVMEIVIPEVGGIKASNDNSIPSYDPIISGTPPNLTPSRESDFFLEIDAFLAVEDESTSSQFPKSYLDPEGDMLLFKAFLNDDNSSDFKTKSSSTSLNSLLEETHTFDNSECVEETYTDPYHAEYNIKVPPPPPELPDIDSFNDIHPHFDDDPISGSTTYSANSLLEEFADELALISYPLDYDDNRICDIESDIREIEFLLYQEMFTEEQPPDYSFPPRFDGEKIKEAELLIDPLDLPCDILSEYDSFNSQDFFRDDVLLSPDNEDKILANGFHYIQSSLSHLFNLGITYPDLID
nr:hypothetical protein [Tanacetum cinerariifolium]